MKTTILGALMILGGIVNAAVQYLQGHQIDLATLGATVTGGLGLIHAADEKKPAP